MLTYTIVTAAAAISGVESRPGRLHRAEIGG
jgi:hypothetical protein